MIPRVSKVLEISMPKRLKIFWNQIILSHQRGYQKNKCTATIDTKKIMFHKAVYLGQLYFWYSLTTYKMIWMKTLFISQLMLIILAYWLMKNFENLLMKANIIYKKLENWFQDSSLILTKAKQSVSFLHIQGM